LVIDRDLDLSNQLKRLPVEGNKAYFAASRTTRLRMNPFAIGCAVLWLPFFVVAHLAASALTLLGAPVIRDGFGFAYELPVFVGSFAYGVLGLYVTKKLLTSLYGEGISRLCQFAILFATPLGYYLWFEPNMSHVVSSFLIATFAYQLYRIYDQRTDKPGGPGAKHTQGAPSQAGPGDKPGGPGAKHTQGAPSQAGPGDKPGGPGAKHTQSAPSQAGPGAKPIAWIVLGLLLGLIALVRPYNGLVALTTIPVAWTVAAATPSRLSAWRRRIGLLVLCGLAAIVVFLPQIVTWKILYGEFFLAPRFSNYDQMTWLQPAVLPYLLSAFPFAPLLLPALVGLIGFRPSQKLETDFSKRGAREAPPAFVSLLGPWFLLVIVAVSYVFACQRQPFAGASFGQRIMVDWSPFFALGLANLVGRRGGLWRRRSTGVILLGMALVNGTLLVLYVLKRLPEFGLAKVWI
jgi:hypothetical protein